MIKAQQLTKKYGTTVALGNVSFQVDEGELFGFIGPDGAGKSTLFRLLTSLLLPSSGKVELFGLDTVKDYKKIREITGYMPGRFSLYPDLSVEENLDFFATVFGTSIQENYHIIHDVYSHIEPFKTRLAGKLSGGMKQKLALSCALIHNPRVLVLDEPTTGVDAVSRKEFWELLRSLKSKGITIIVSTPYMDEAGLCDRVALIHHGRLLTVDKPGAITSSYEKQILGIVADNTYKLLDSLRKYPDVLHAYAFGQQVHYTGRKASADLNNMRAYLGQCGHKDVQIMQIKAGIEDVFIDLVQDRQG
ncbi:MAG: ABC transporter ATP-binding protein [Bacteroidales bacterium]|nr:ABC transporter ATP-binding protein [Bacteroidales bacterium]